MLFHSILPDEQFDEYVNLLKWKTIADQASIFDPFNTGAIDVFKFILNPLYITKDYNHMEIHIDLKKFTKTDNSYLLEWAFDWVYPKEESFLYGYKFIAWSLFTKNDEIIERCIINSNLSFNDVIIIYLYTYYVTNNKELCKNILDKHLNEYGNTETRERIKTSLYESINSIDLERINTEYKFTIPDHANTLSISDIIDMVTS